MTIRDDLATVVELACLTGDRTPTEQRALLATAMRTELDLNAATTRNLRTRGPTAQPSTLVDTAEASHTPSEGRPIVLPPKARARVDRQRARFTHDLATAWTGPKGAR